MRDMEESSRRIGEVIELIDSVAFQTNILALNASVEAARAGEHGRGFAVVASEVRTLASRTADSSQEIRRMIEEVTRQVSEGSSQAGRSGEKIREVVDAIRQVAGLVDELALSATEQQSGADQIGAAITQMDTVTQENASLVEQTSTASANLEGEARRLAKLTGSFRLNAAAHGTGEAHSVAPLMPPREASADDRNQQLGAEKAKVPVGGAMANTREEPQWEAF
ncbi:MULTISPECIES: methyl-accepting chemotaxis protein [unclassified Halomonas]|uniref:methyl-accepting chemotaxis protein n=1 Tax=unclassified Halomonas TaxID=2609666 RepID=UPI0028853DAD|nr:MULTISPECIES: methyl-accepting chemotaxis protein [unclassified Halomonas]MDT0500485.1 methyl-accepting chemotaxis protein [Halomonas sp. PAR7]MDT0511619.1 methyl-accepting chemotaxis protein [Halomonas sp. LES1]MDT0590093.1 methyl-accepting chemotaxis protein [Halomonas sp. PAR8]